MSAAPGIRRIFLDYDSTLNPGQGNEPLSADRSEMLAGYLKRWQEAGVGLYLLTASNPDVKSKALEAANLKTYFEDVLSSSSPTPFVSKGDYIQNLTNVKDWESLEQILVDDSVEAIASTAGWSFSAPDKARKGQPVAHTFRLPQHSKAGLSAEDLKYLETLVMGPKLRAIRHCFAGTHDSERFLDEADGDLKCMEFTVNTATLRGFLASNPEMTEGRPDFAAIAGKSSAEKSQANFNMSGGYPTQPASPGKGGGGGKGKMPAAVPKGPKNTAAEDETPEDAEGSRVEVLEGMHAGKAGVVLKRSEDSEGIRWRVLVEGGALPTWVDKVKVLVPARTAGGPAPGAGAAPSKKVPAVSDTIKVTGGPFDGKTGVVVKLVEDEAEPRWRVAIEGGPTTWVDSVKLVKEGSGSGGAGGKPSGSNSGFDVGCTVEITSGAHGGKKGVVTKVTGENEERRWKLDLTGGGSTWADEVTSASGVRSSTISFAGTKAGGSEERRHAPVARAAAAAARSSRVPCPNIISYLHDDSCSECTDTDMPDLVPLD